MTNQKVRNIGTHLMMTIVECNNERLQDYDRMYGLLKHLPNKIGMSLIDVKPNPILHSCYSPKNPLNYGLSGFSLLHESHCSLHAFPEENTIDMDIFSCYDFDWQKALYVVEVFFRGKAINVSVVKRGDNRKCLE